MSCDFGELPRGNGDLVGRRHCWSGSRDDLGVDFLVLLLLPLRLLFHEEGVLDGERAKGVS